MRLLSETDLEKELEMLDVNVRALHILTKAFCRKCSGRSGALLNVGSSAGLLPAGPYMATYYATKSYVVSLTCAAAEELRSRGSSVYVGCLCPGPVDTEFNKVANVRFALPGISAAYCVRRALAGMRRHKTVIVPGPLMAAGMAMSHLVPRGVLIRMAEYQQKRKISR